MYRDFNEAGGGGGFNPFHNLPHYLLVHYGSFDFAKYVAATHTDEDAPWHTMHPRLGQERVFSFDPAHYNLDAMPKDSANIAAFAYLGNGEYEWFGTYVYGSRIEPDTARAIISLSVPDLDKKRIETLFPDELQYVLNRNNGVSMIMHQTVAVYDPLPRSRPEIYCHPRLRKS